MYNLVHLTPKSVSVTEVLLLLVLVRVHTPLSVAPNPHTCAPNVDQHISFGEHSRKDTANFLCYASKFPLERPQIRGNKHHIQSIWTHRFGEPGFFLVLKLTIVHRMPSVST